MGKKKRSSAAVKASGTKQDRAKAAAAANPVRTEDVKRPARAPKSATASTPATPTTPANPATPSNPAAPFRRPASFNFAGVGRNDICPCGSGKRFKNCHGH